jgi:hypothetical protein
VQFVQSHTPVAKAGPMGSGNLLCVHHWHPEHTIPGYVPRVLGVGHLLLWSQADMILETAPQGPETSQFLSASQAGVWQEGPGHAQQRQCHRLLQGESASYTRQLVLQMLLVPGRGHTQPETLARYQEIFFLKPVISWAIIYFFLLLIDT